MLRMIGKIPVDISQNEDEITFTFSDGDFCTFHHEQDCCEIVTIDDVNGDWSDLIGVPIIVAEERIGEYVPDGWEDKTTWTFYTFRTIKGSVDVIWRGESNGYYSESVDFSWNGTDKWGYTQ